MALKAVSLQVAELVFIYRAARILGGSSSREVTRPNSILERSLQTVGKGQDQERDTKDEDSGSSHEENWVDSGYIEKDR